MEKALDVVEKRIKHLEIVSNLTGDPNTYWKLEEARKIMSLLVDEQTSLLLEEAVSSENNEVEQSENNEVEQDAAV